MGKCLDGVVQACRRRAVGSRGNFVVLHAGEGVLDAGPDFPAFDVVGCLAERSGTVWVFALPDEKAGVEVDAVGEYARPR